MPYSASPAARTCPTYDALYDAGIRNILCRHEQGAGHAAEGYAKASGKVGRRARDLGPGRDQPRHARSPTRCSTRCRPSSSRARCGPT